MIANHLETPCSEIDFIDLSRFAMPLRRMSGNRYRRAIQKRRRMFGGVTNDSGVFHQAEEIELACLGRCCCPIAAVQGCLVRGYGVVEPLTLRAAGRRGRVAPPERSRHGSPPIRRSCSRKPRSPRPPR
jgi:hypothetical protein